MSELDQQTNATKRLRPQAIEPDNDTLKGIVFAQSQGTSTNQTWRGGSATPIFNSPFKVQRRRLMEYD